MLSGNLERRNTQMKSNYMTRLERWARWMLPRQEAEDVLADYRDIVADPELARDLGRPRSVIRPLADRKAYYTWLGVFAVMAACVLTLGSSASSIGYLLFWRLLFDGPGPYPYGAFLTAALGAAAALIWFRRHGRKEARSPIPKGITAVLALLLIWIGLIFLFYWAVIRDIDRFVSMWGTTEYLLGPPGRTVPRSVYYATIAMCYLPFFASFPAVYWLVKARVGDRRWAAAYILALTAILISLETVAELISMNPAAPPPEVSLRARLLQCAVTAALGLAGTGVALC